MYRRPPRSTRTDTRFPYATLCRSPEALVLRLIRSGMPTALASEERVVTVMFTDVRGFSALTERMGAADTAELLNEHFATLAGCIEAEGGTVDKFIGDSVMAFWGAPEIGRAHV